MPSDTRTWPIAAVAAALAALVLSVGFAGWIRHAGELMLSLGQAGLSWCL
ncbi:hypothetical protein [Gellertiella hungarica]|uniref:Uncharacterized protein n=1 Tax=Gellertiella hungarica TaxID=1572859 RepID=A0A7W6J2G9_9HYPH|nr:hypothetical protein [Gellertiella hungarica]MBB4063566.1 hypothetical protein [Gellertiella hungarica]